MGLGSEYKTEMEISSMENEEKYKDKPSIIFADGIWFNRSDKAPEYIIGNLEIDSAKFLPFFEDNNDAGKLRLVIKLSKKGNTYISVDTWKPTKKEDAPHFPEEELPGLPPPAEVPAGPGHDECGIDDIPF